MTADDPTGAAPPAGGVYEQTVKSTDDYFKERQRHLEALQENSPLERADEALKAADAALPSGPPQLGPPPLMPAPIPPGIQLRQELPAEDVKFRAPPRAKRDDRAELNFEETEGLGGVHATIHMQKTRIDWLQRELDATKTSLHAREKEAAELRGSNRELREESSRMAKRLVVAEREAEKATTKNKENETRFKETDVEAHELRRELEALRSKYKKLEAETRAKDARLARMTEDSERYKSALKDAKQHRDEETVLGKKDSEKIAGEVRRLEKQRAELIAAFRKQQRVVDIADKQRHHLELAKLLSFTEEEFTRLLEIGPTLA